jgi:hypothetical protein
MSVPHTEIKSEEIVESIEEKREEIKPEIIKEYTLTEAIQDATEHILRYIIFWESDDKKIGMIIQIIHHSFIYGMILWYFYVHTFSTSYIQLFLLTCIWFIVWLQHVCCHACFFFNIEQKLIGSHTTIVDHILHLFNIPTSDEIRNGIFFIISSLIMCMLSCEVLSRTIINIKSLF